MGREKKEKLKIKARAEKAKSKGGLHSWQQAKSLSEKNQRSDWGAPSWDQGLRDSFSFRWSFLHLLFFTAIISPLHTHYNWSHASPHQGHIVTTGPHSPCQVHGINRTARRDTLPSPPLYPPVLWLRNFQGSTESLALNLSLHPCVLRGSGFQTTGRVNLKSVAVKSSRVLGCQNRVSLGASLQL